MLLHKRKLASGREPTITLINIVFLMLVFFLVAGTIAQPLDADLKLVNTAELEGRAPPNALVVLADGSLRFEGQPLASAAAYVAALPENERATLRLVPDRALPAGTLVDLARKLQAAGAGKIMLVTERGLK